MPSNNHCSTAQTLCEPVRSLPRQLANPTAVAAALGGADGSRAAGVSGAESAAVVGQVAGPLVVLRNQGTPPPDEALARRRAGRWLALRGGGKLLPGTRLAHCHRTPIMAGVGILHSASRGRASYSGLQTCGSVHVCPVCAYKIAGRRRAELEEGVAAAKARGYAMLFLTYTVQHQAKNGCLEVLEWLRGATRRFRYGRPWQELKRRIGLVGYVTTTEVTHGDNGWHPHAHEVWICSGITEDDLVPLMVELQGRWQAAVEAAGGSCRRSVGLRVEWVADGEDAVGDYLLKSGQWGICDEMSQAATKKARTGGRTVAALLEDYSLHGDQEAGRLFQEYAAAFHGRRVHRWSVGLREHLGLCCEASDADVAAEVDDDAVLLAQLNLREWRRVLERGLEAELLWAVEQLPSRSDVEDWLDLMEITDEVRVRVSPAACGFESGGGCECTEDRAPDQPRRNGTEGSQIARSGVELPGREAQLTEVDPHGEARTQRAGDGGGDGRDGRPSAGDDDVRGVAGVRDTGFRPVAGDGRDAEEDGLQHGGGVQAAGRFPVGRGPGGGVGRRGSRVDGPGGETPPAA